MEDKEDWNTPNTWGHQDYTQKKGTTEEYIEIGCKCFEEAT